MTNISKICDMNKVKISIITATYNCAETLPDCFASIASQNYAHREHVVVDGGSQDTTIDVIQKHIDQIDTLKSEPDTGIYDALNKGINLSTGDVIGFLHADDIYASDDVLTTIAKAFEDSTVCAVYGDLEYVKQDDTNRVVRRWTSKPFERKDLDRGWMPPHPTLYVWKKWYREIGGFNTNYRIAADYLSVLQLFASDNFRATYIPKTLVKMRVGGASNKSLKQIIRKTKEDWNALRKQGFSLFNTVLALAYKNLTKISQFKNV